MTHDDVQRWLDGYVDAWRTNQPDPIAALFTDDAVYRYRPYGADHAVEGRDAIVEAWLAEPDDPESWEAEYRVYAVDGDRAVAVGWSRYHRTDRKPDRIYHNCFLLRFDGRRCAEFTELYMEEESGSG